MTDEQRAGDDPVIDRLANAIGKMCNINESDIPRDQSTRIDELKAERDGWKDSAAQFLRNQEFYQGIVKQIGETFGVAARTSDDGSIQDDVLALKVPELVTELQAELAVARQALDDNWVTHQQVIEARTQLAARDAKLTVMAGVLKEVAEQLGGFFNVVYGANLDVVGWHMNGDLEPLDNFIDENIDSDLLAKLTAALAAAAE